MRKCRVVWAKVGTYFNSRLYEECLANGNLQAISETNFSSYSGDFSHKCIDSGSEFLAECLPSEIEGSGADLGAGYGFLSHAMLSRSDNVKEIHLYEADYRSLMAAKHNLRYFKKRTITFNWHDVRKGLLHSELDWVVMNPPFHDSEEGDPSLGQKFIAVAANHIRRRGKLFMVANRHLPYEQQIRQFFSRILQIEESKGFKVYILQK